MNPPPLSSKDEIRRAMRQRRAAVDPAWARDESRRLCERLRGLPHLQRARRIGAYLPQPGEADLEPLLREWDAAGKEIYVPAFHPEAGVYRMARYRPDAPLRRGRFGIREPERPEWRPAAELDAFLAPGLAFDRNGNRLGHGGGVFDRLLADTDGWRFGVGFSFQQIENLPADAHDCRMHAVVTPEESTWCPPSPSRISNP